MAITRDDERGIGLIDVLVAMLLLSILAIAVVPTIVIAMKTSSNNVDTSTASELVDRDLDQVQIDIPTTCAALTSWASDEIGAGVTDPRGTVLEVHRVFTQGCPSLYPGLVTVSVWVSKQGQTQPLAQATARMQLTSAN